MICIASANISSGVALRGQRLFGYCPSWANISSGIADGVQLSLEAL